MSFQLIRNNTTVCSRERLRDWLYGDFEAQVSLSLRYIFNRIDHIYRGQPMTIEILQHLLRNNIIRRQPGGFMLRDTTAPIIDQLWFNHLLI